MRLTRRQLQTLIENYLYEQSAISDLEDEPAEDDESAAGDAPPEEETDMPEEEAETPEEDTEPAEPEINIGNAKPFDIVDSKGIKTKIQFYEEEVDGNKKIFVKANGETLKNADKSTMLGLSGVCVMGVKDEETRKVCAKIAQAMDDNLKKHGDNVESLSKDIERKAQGSRFPFDNFEKLISKARG